MSASSNASAARAWVEIDLPAIDRNVGRIKQALPPHVRYVAVVKANAYGHGMPEVATRLLQAGVDCFAVANVAEAANLREIGHDADILLLSPTLPSELPRALALGLDVTLNSLEEDLGGRGGEVGGVEARVGLVVGLEHAQHGVDIAAELGSGAHHRGQQRVERAEADRFRQSGGHLIFPPLRSWSMALASSSISRNSR